VETKKCHPIVDFGEEVRVAISVDGRPLMARRGRPIAAALIEEGIDVFRITEKTGSPRSLFCGIGQCNDCVMEVNGIPNVRTCVTPVEENMVIRTQDGLGRVGDPE